MKKRIGDESDRAVSKEDESTCLISGNVMVGNFLWLVIESLLLSLYEIFTNAKQNSSYSFITHLCLCIYVDRLSDISLAYY